MTEVDEVLRQSILRYMSRRPDLKRKPWCERAGLSSRTLSRFLNNTANSITHNTLLKLANAEGVDVGVLTGELPDPLDDSAAETNLKDRNSTLQSSSTDLAEDDVYNLQLIVQLLRQLTEQGVRTERLLAEMNENLKLAVSPDGQAQDFQGLASKLR